MRTPILVGCILVLAACSSGQGIVTKEDLQPQDLGAADLQGELPGVDAVVDLAVPDSVVEPDELRFDAEPDQGGPACAPGEGCFLDPCSENDDCLSGWCVEHMGEDVCTLQCTEECPPGWSCQQVAGTAPDLVFVCVSDVANLCRPCATGDNCKSVGGAEDVCVDYGVEGSFCGGACLSNEDCPWGFSCGEALTVDGISTKQCVADAGVCPCTKKAIELALWTPCEIENEFGTCNGKRVCTDSGLTDCDAAAPTIEECDGVDNDCDGDVDEGEFVGGKYQDLCNDGNPCTDDQCLGEGGCDFVALDEGECQDGNPCTVADHCEAGVCVGAPVECDDDNPCTDNVCTEKGGCEYPPVAGECDDGQVCTLGDHCIDGECVGEAVACDCLVDADCAALEDGNLCNGTLFCDTGKVPYQCQVEPGTEVLCPEPEGHDAPCLAGSCDPATGKCSFVPAGDGKPCEDGDLCTLADTCLDGICTGGKPANCNDGNPCTDDSCDPDDGCFFVDNDVACNDGNACTTADACAMGACVGGAPLVCNDGNHCNGVESCDPASGCKPGTPLACDDGNACNGTESCVSDIGCVAGQPLACDDGNACDGVESCDPVKGCVAGTPLVCDDGDACNGLEICKPATGCVPGTPLDCDDGNPCTDDSCNPAEGCIHATSDGECDDGNACTLADKCVDGLCKPGLPVSCDDKNICTTDSCDPLQGCVHMLNTAPCNDGDLCTINDQCQLGECVGSGALICDDGNPCTADSCGSEVGCKFTPIDGDCDDGTQCTTGDHCKNGACVPSAFVVCNDDNPCTDDSCDPLQGCVFAPNEKACTDNDACTVGDVCAGGTCVSGPPADCDDGNVCTDETCNPAQGCVYTLNNQPCDDGTECTGNDTCAGGECNGTPISCDDANVCTDDSCDDDLGCVHLDNEEPCDDGSVCTTVDQCTGGQCVGEAPLACDDANECTEDACDAALGCQYANVPDGTACDNGSKKCFNGQCLAGSVHLRLYLNFEEGQGNTAHDLAPSGNQTNGTLYGNTSFASPGKLGDYCLKVDGTTAADRVTLAGNISDLNMASEYTYMLWMKSYQSGSKGLIGLGSCCNTRQGYTMNINGSGEVRFWGGSDSNDNNYNTYAGGQPVHDGNWHHIAIRVKPGSLQILVDGSVKANGESNIPTSPSLAPANNSNITYVPHVGGDGIDNVNGARVYIDEVRVYDKFLSDSEIQQAMNGVF